MQSLLRSKGVLRIGLLALTLAVALSSVAAAKPEPGAQARRGFRLFARSLGAMTVNRIYCGLSATGEVCVDSTNSSTIGGGFWPKGTADQYVFNSGIQLAGTIGTDGGPWAGDTTGAFFFDPKGTTQHGEQVTPIYNTQNPDDAAFIAAGTDNAAMAARIPNADDNRLIFNSLLQGRDKGSQGDVWWLSWDGNPGLVAGRPHPLGVVVEQRGLGWNYPSGNQDILYFIYTFYNITSLNAADYAGVRPGMREILMQQAQVFQQRNEASFGVSIPDGGYTIDNLYAGFGADMDVADAGVNYSSVNVPFALGNTYERSFSRFAGWSFDPTIFNQPGLFSGTGFVGVKYLKSPEDANGNQVGLTLFSNTINGGVFGDARNTTQLFRYLSGHISPAAGDQNCSLDPVATHICYINNTSGADMRFFQSSGPLKLAPGGFGSIVVAYIFAAPAAAGGTASCGTVGSTCDIKPGNLALIAGMDNPTTIGAPVGACPASGACAFGGNVNLLDSITGFLGARDLNSNDTLSQDEFKVVPNSLLGKALVAQAIFDNGFLLPFSPEPPPFFLVPGDNQVTVMWRPSSSEQAGDPFYSIASQATLNGAPNPLYDPSYRQYDVEGYRVYRGRVDAPNSLQLLAQFDYAGTTIPDYRGQINPSSTCAPELGITTTCATTYDPVDSINTPGVQLALHVDVPLSGPIIQVKIGDRVLLADGTALVVNADTAGTGGSGSCAPSNCPELSDTGVPFVYVDNTVRNNFRYFYSVTTFDINSFQSGPSNLESPRLTKAVTPVAPAGNYENTATLDVAVYGRGQKLTDDVVPTIDPVKGTFSKPFPPATGWQLGLTAFVKQLIASPGAFSATLDSLTLGSAYDGTPNIYYITLNTAAGGATQLTVPLAQPSTDGAVTHDESFTVTSVDASLASRYGGNGSYTLSGSLHMEVPGNYYTNSFGRGCVNGADGFGDNCDYNGARWFDGPSPQQNETQANPTACSQQNFTTNVVTCFTNAGYLSGVDNIYEPMAYQTIQSTWRQFHGALGGAVRAADFNVYWGTGGTIDSVIDVTDNVVVPFSPTIGASWGILNAQDAPAAGAFDASATLTPTDFSCVAPLNTVAAVQALIACGAATPFVLTQTAVPGPIGYITGTVGNVVPATENGFEMYLSGHIFTFELTGGALPAAGTVWTMRSYTGAINGGGQNCTLCQAGDDGPYSYVQQWPFPMAAVGAEVRFTYDVINQVNAPTGNDLSKVHTVPDPYYVTNAYEQTTDTKIIKFVNLPQDCIIRIYSSSGVLVQLLEHHSSQFGGEETWNVRNRNNQVVASGVYFYHVEAGNARRVGRFTIVNFAQ